MSEQLRLTRIQRDFLSHVCMRPVHGKAILVAEDVAAASTLKVLGFVRIDTKPTWATPRCFPTAEGFSWLCERYLGGLS